MTVFIKVKQVDGRVGGKIVLLDLSIIQGFYEDPFNRSQCTAYYKIEHTPQNRPQTSVVLAHSVTEISNAIQAQMQCVEVVDLTLDDMAEPENESTEE
jgi:hypothetical protein